MKMNSELRTKRMIFRYRVKWVVFYLLVLAFLGLFGAMAYARLDNDNYAEGHIELTLNKERYQLGETIEFSITNHFTNPIYVANNCPEEPLNVYKWYTNRWIQIHGEADSKDSFCYTQPRRITIQPDEGLTYHFEDWPDLFDAPGVYRIVVPVEHYNDLPFRDFVILEPAEVIINPAPTTDSAPSNQTNEPVSNPQPTVEQNEENEDPLFEDDGRPRNEDGGDD